MNRCKATTVFQTMIVLFALTVSPRAHATPGKTLVPGDVNCDDHVDISDVVFLVASLYLGAGPPCPIADRPELLAQVEDLQGQVALLHADLAAKVVELAEAADLLVAREADLRAQYGAQAAGLQAQLDARGATLQAVGDQLAACEAELKAWKENHWEECRNRWDRFVRNGDGTMTDTCTGLMWKQGAIDVNGDGVINFDNFPYDLANWSQAKDAARSLTLGGHDDWRLPEIEELLSLDMTDLWPARCAPPALGIPCRQLAYWTATSDRPGLVWVISTTYRANGDSYWYTSVTDLNGGFAVLAVRNP